MVPSLALVVDLPGQSGEVKTTPARGDSPLALRPSAMIWRFTKGGEPQLGPASPLSASLPVEASLPLPVSGAVDESPCGDPPSVGPLLFELEQPERRTSAKGAASWRMGRGQ